MISRKQTATRTNTAVANQSSVRTGARTNNSRPSAAMNAAAGSSKLKRRPAATPAASSRHCAVYGGGTFLAFWKGNRQRCGTEQKRAAKAAST